jgi:hypothetical protein
VQADGEEHEIAVREPELMCFGRGTVTYVQAEPLKRSTRTRSLLEFFTASPTAKHAPEDGHDMPSSREAMGDRAPASGSTLHAEPFQCSTSEKNSPLPFP